MTFENTDLLDHPSVRDAYELMSTFISDDAVLAQQVLQAGEILSGTAENPDPDAVAACIIMDSSLVPIMDIDSLRDFISEKTANYLERLSTMDANNPVYTDDAERQFHVAHAIAGIDEARAEITDDTRWRKHREIKAALDRNETKILAAGEGAAMQGLVQAAQDKLIEARNALEELVRTTQATATFESSGLPEHPTLKAAFELVRASQIDADPLFTNRTMHGTDTVKALLETGTSDPDILAAAMLNQYWEKGNGALAGKISDRAIELYRQTSPFSEDKNIERSEEGQTIVNVIWMRALETLQAEYVAYKNLPEDRYSRDVASDKLEHIEDFMQKVEKSSRDVPAGALRSRMDKAVAGAQKMIRMPENSAIRAPGSPPRPSPL